MNTTKKSHSFIILSTLLLGVGLTVFGLLQQQWPTVLPTRNLNAVVNYLIFMIGSTLLIIISACLTKRSFLTITIVLGLCITLWVGELLSLTAIFLYAVASLTVGQMTFQLLKIEEPVDDIYKVLVGAGIYASIVGLMAHLPINYSHLYFAGLLLPVACKFKWSITRIKNIGLRLFREVGLPCSQDWPKVVLAALSLLYFSIAFLPEFGYDALATHLLVPAHISINHEWVFDPTLYIWTFMLMLGDWHYTIGYLIAGETGSRLINVGFIYIISYLIKELVVWAGGGEKGATWAMLLFLSTPLTFLEGSSLFVESIWASYFLASLLWLLKVSMEHDRHDGSILLVGLMLGFAMAAKAVTLIYLPILLLPFLCRANVFFSKRFRVATVGGIVLCMMVGIIPYGVAYWMIGNPVFPLYNAYFNSPFYPPANFDNQLFKSVASWDLPYQLVFASEKYIEGTVGSSGFQWVMLLISAAVIIFLLKNIRAIILFGMGALLLTLLFYFQSYLRYAFPVLIIVCVLMGVLVTLSQYVGKFSQVSVEIVAAATLGLNLLFLGASGWAYRDIPVMEAFNKNHDHLILQKGPIRKAIASVNRLNESRSPVVFLSNPFGVELNADALYDSWYNPNFTSAMNKTNSPESFAEVLNQYNAKYVILDSSWRNEKMRNMVESSTVLVEDFGKIKLRVLKNEFIID